MICCRLVVDMIFVLTGVVFAHIASGIYAKGSRVCLAGDGPTQIIESDCQVNLCIHYMPGHHQCRLQEDQKLG